MKPIQFKQPIFLSTVISLAVISSLSISGCARDRSYSRVGGAKYPSTYPQTYYQTQPTYPSSKTFEDGSRTITPTISATNQAIEDARNEAQKIIKETAEAADKEVGIGIVNAEKDIQLEQIRLAKEARLEAIRRASDYSRSLMGETTLIATALNVRDLLTLKNFCEEPSDEDDVNIDGDAMTASCEKEFYNKGEGFFTSDENPNLLPVTAFKTIKSDWDNSPGSKWDNLFNSIKGALTKALSGNSSSNLEVLFAKILEKQQGKTIFELLKDFFEKAKNEERLLITSNENSFSLVKTLIADVRNNETQLPGVNLPRKVKNDEIVFYVSQFYYFPSPNGDVFSLGSMGAKGAKLPPNENIVMALFANNQLALSTSKRLGSSQGNEVSIPNPGRRCGVPMTFVVAIQPDARKFEQLLWHNLFALREVQSSSKTEKPTTFKEWNFLDPRRISPRQVSDCSNVHATNLFDLATAFGAETAARPKPDQTVTTQASPTPVSDVSIPVGNVLFGRGNDELSELGAPQKKALESLGTDVLKPFESFIKEVQIGGHANQGRGDSDQGNETSAKNRANTVKGILDRHVLDTNKIKSTSKYLEENAAGRDLTDQVNCSADICIVFNGQELAKDSTQVEKIKVALEPIQKELSQSAPPAVGTASPQGSKKPSTGSTPQPQGSNQNPGGTKSSKGMTKTS